MEEKEQLLTAKAYGRLPDIGSMSELVLGLIVTFPYPAPRHGQICAAVGRLLGNYISDRDLGHMVLRSGVITERNPDTVRGPDLSFYSYAKVPKGPLPRGYLPVPPDLVFEVRSEDDRWQKIQLKVAEYLNAGVAVVCVLDDDPPTAYVYTADGPVRIVTAGEELTFPEILGAFRVPVRRFFE
jgi:Uma2 family endonuclease